MQRNLIALYLVKLSKWFTLVMPIIVLFYEEHRLGLQDVFILKSVYSVAAVALEVPSGYLADVWGRKRCIVAGCVLFFGGYLCYSLTSTFAAFLVAEILLGIGQTMINGADSALLYDTSVHHGRENLYLRYEGRITTGCRRLRGNTCGDGAEGICAGEQGAKPVGGDSADSEILVGYEQEALL